MNTTLEDAFTDDPPFGLMPFSTKALGLISRLLHYAGLQALDADFLGAYILVSNGKTRATEHEIMDAYNSMTTQEIDEIMAYIVRVRKRQAEAAIEVEDSPGKSDT